MFPVLKLRNLRVVLSALIVAAIAFLMIGNGAALDGVKLFAVVVAQPASWASLIFMACRVRALTGGEVPFAQGLRSSAVTLFSGYVIPTRAADAVKALFLRLSMGLPLGKGVAIVFFERLSDVICVLALLVALILLKGPRTDDMGGVTYTLAAFVILGIGLVLVGVLAPNAVNALVRRIPWQKLREFAANGLDAMRAMATPAKLLPGIAWAVPTWLASYLIFSCYFHATGGPPLAESDILVVFLLATLGLTVSVLPAGLGTFEGAIVLALAPHGYGFPDALVVALMLRLAGFIPVAIVSGWVMAVDRIDLRTLKISQIPPRDAST